MGVPFAAAASVMARRSSMATARITPGPAIPASLTGTRSGGSYLRPTRSSQSTSVVLQLS